MGEIKQIDIKNQTYYYLNNIISIKVCWKWKVDGTLLKIDKNSYKNISIYNIGYITKKKIDYCEKIYSVNPLYLLIDHASRYIEEKGVNKYLVFDSTDENKESLYLLIDHASGYIEEKGVNKYFVFDFTDENKELLKKIQQCF